MALKFFSGGVRIFKRWVRNAKSAHYSVKFFLQNVFTLLHLKKLMGLVNPSLKIDGFGRTHRTRANATTAIFKSCFVHFFILPIPITSSATFSQ